MGAEIAIFCTPTVESSRPLPIFSTFRSSPCTLSAVFQYLHYYVPRSSTLFRCLPHVSTLLPSLPHYHHHSFACMLLFTLAVRVSLYTFFWRFSVHSPLRHHLKGSRRFIEPNNEFVPFNALVRNYVRMHM